MGLGVRVYGSRFGGLELVLFEIAVMELVRWDVRNVARFWLMVMYGS